MRPVCSLQTLPIRVHSSMITLGINDGHDAGVCLMKDGRPLIVSVEERRINAKNHAGIPVESIKSVFKSTGIDPKEVDLITLSSKIRTTFPTKNAKPIYKVLHVLTSLARTEWATSLGRRVLPMLRKRKELLECLASHGLAEKPLLPLDHHRCHAATAYYHRPWSGASTVLTLDGLPRRHLRHGKHRSRQPHRCRCFHS